VGDNKTFNINAQQLLKAGFNYNVIYGCTQDVVNIFLAGRNISNFTWYIDGTLISTNQNPVITYKNFGTKTIKLVASNSVCADSLTVTYTLPTPNLRANFTAPDFACPNDSIVFKDASTGNPLFWNWDFGNGQTSALQNPPAQNYPLVNTAKELPVRLAVKDSACSDTTYRLIKIIPNCYIAVPSAFTPNNDGLNDYLYPLNAYKANNLQFRVYNRFGQIVFESNNRTAKWDGRFKSIPQPSGTYVWSLEYTDADTGKVIALKGTSVLIR
jgi:gliding motility-associated-like protein